MKSLIKKSLLVLVMITALGVGLVGATKTNADVVRVTGPATNLNGLAGLVAVNNLTSPYRYGGYYGAPYGGYYAAPTYGYGGYAAAPYVAPTYGGYGGYGNYVSAPVYGGYGYGNNSLGELIVLNSLFGR